MEDRVSIQPPTIAAVPREGSRASGRSRGRGRGGGGGGVTAQTLLALVLVALAAGGWFIYEQQRALRDNDRALTDADRRIARLEDRLRMTDETLSESDAETDDKLSFWETEIRKVWDIANKRNKGWIVENRASIESASEALASAKSDLATLKDTVARLDVSAENQQEVADSVTNLEMRFQRLQKTHREFVDKVNVAETTAADLEGRLRDTETAIAAIDAGRTTVTRQLTELRAAVADINTRLSGTPAPEAGFTPQIP